MALGQIKQEGFSNFDDYQKRWIVSQLRYYCGRGGVVWSRGGGGVGWYGVGVGVGCVELNREICHSRKHYPEQQLHSKSILCIRSAHVAGMFWHECRQMWREGPKDYLSDWWNWMDSSLIFLYLAYYAMQFVVYAKVDKVRIVGLTSADKHRLKSRDYGDCDSCRVWKLTSHQEVYC